MAVISISLLFYDYRLQIYHDLYMEAQEWFPNCLTQDQHGLLLSHSTVWMELCRPELPQFHRVVL